MINPHTLSDEELFYGNIALCFSGSTVNAFALKEELSDSLTSLLAPTYSFETIARRAFDKYVDVSKKLCFALAGDKGQAAVMFSGFCVESRRERAFLFKPSLKTANEYEFSNILETDGQYEFLGSGAKAGKRLLGATSQPVTTSLLIEVLEAVIEDDKVDSVGGNVRVGGFDKYHSFTSAWLSRSKRR
ncbi:hypothetical protein EN871_27735 [bacterium M00.F.Ca.ET.228.01.1.1]|nr:hypothetical protein EN871_27735 [bacterium M00.F.Ca.ET.228.01.1.1]TGR96701.1 hypothetical protein EN834_27255 [bacterium M00.F.Ca.ET.191.01.1.1]